MNAGQPIYAVSGQVAMAGPPWRWSLIAIPVNCWVGTCPRSGKASTAASALEHALIERYGTLGRVAKPFLLRSDNRLVFTSRN